MGKFLQKLKEIISKIPRHVWILALIILFGFFLRSYNLHSWLKFRDDQARDAALVSRAVEGKQSWPIMGAYMSYSGDGDHSEANSFHLGPIYYYFQIVSAKVFGNYADKLAYPDVFFGTLSILLLYLFLKIYFERNLSLGLTGLYAISAYFVQYSRFAWNTNLIPFFVLLLLLSLHKFLEKNEKVAWKWAILLGIALGVGVQLHAILIVLFLPVAFLVLVFTAKKNFAIWKKWAIVLLVFLTLNATQIYSEIKTDFNNTKILFNFSSHDDNAKSVEKVGKISLIKNDIDCNIEANSYFLSSFGSSNCTYEFLNPSAYGQLRTKYISKLAQDLGLRIAMLMGIMFSIFGYYLLLRYSKKEIDGNKKYFLYLVSLYIIASFVLMIPLSIDKFNDLRYLTPTFFVPYVLLGFLMKFIKKKFQSKQKYIITFVFAVILLLNIIAIANVAIPLLAKDRTCSSRSTTIGELEPVAEYMISKSKGGRIIRFGGDKAFRVAYGPLSYILSKHGIVSEEIPADPSLSESDVPTFMISCKSGIKEKYAYKEIGSIFVFDLSN